MNKRYSAIVLAVSALVGCAPVYDTDNLPIEILPEPEIVYEGSGALLFGDDDAEMSGCTYSWKADGDVINFNFIVDLDEYAANDSWEIGHFYLDQNSIADFLGATTSELSNDNFTPYNPDGSATSWTSYEPGMWVNAEGVGCGWSEGSLYWQWYIYSSTSYDYDFASHKGMLIIGGNPGNTVKLGGSAITSKAVITLGDRKVDFVVNVSFKGEAYVEPTEPEAPMDYLTCGSAYPYGAGASGKHQYTWQMTEEGVVVDVDAYIPAIEDWGYLLMGIAPEAMTSYLGIEDINQLADYSYFYALEPDGSAAEKWTSYAPGQWVDETGASANWSNGALFWQYQFGENKYEGHYTEGLLVIGTNPGNVENLGGKTVTSKAQLGEKTFTVNVTYYSELPTSKAGKIGNNSYSWELKDEGMSVVGNVSLAALDDSWGLFGFPINETYVNEMYDITIDDLDLESFYPVDADGNKGEKWTSYAPGQWFKADGSAGAWDTGIAFWQYYTNKEYDYALPNLFYLGKNPDTAANNYKVGDSYVSKAMLAGKEFKVTINVVD